MLVKNSRGGVLSFMIVKPKIRNNICLTAHPEGCAQQVKNQIDYVRSKGPITAPVNVLIIGSSNGYGLAARITSAFGGRADTIGVSYERPGTGTRVGTAGWYNERAFLREAERAKVSAWNVDGDAFSDQTKEEVVKILREKAGPVDLVIYSIASARRKDPKSGELYATVLKPVGKSCRSKTVDFQTGKVFKVDAEPATREEIESTVKVMGGEDWALWLEALSGAGLLMENVLSVAFSYIGSSFTKPIYRDGTIGKAKEHLEKTAVNINKKLAAAHGKAIISINKALVTQASAVIPSVSLYISLLYKVMKKKRLHENCIQQMFRLFRDFLYADNPGLPDDMGRIRLDDLEMREDVQREVAVLWDAINSENVELLSDIEGFRDEFLRYHGFGVPGVDYGKDVET